jgi:hypothetical protein
VTERSPEDGLARRPPMTQPSARINIENVTVEPGQTLNVWLHTPDGQTQVELRVTHNGVPEIFCDRVETQQFAYWKPLATLISP